MPRGYVDLQMRFAALDSGVDVVVWVEIKHGAPLSAEQLPTYREALRRRHKPAGRAGAIVLLDSVTRLPHERAPPEVPQRSWERTGISIRQFKDQYVTDPVERWLCDELLAYLQEEHITYPDALGPEHLTALAYIREAEHALKAICTEAQARIPEVIAGKPFRLSQDDPPPYKRANAWVEFIAWWWPCDEPENPAWRDAWLEWHVFYGGHLERSSSGQVSAHPKTATSIRP